MSSDDDLRTLTLIDRVCDTFEDALRTGGTPSLELVMNGCEADQQRELFRELLLLEQRYLSDADLRQNAKSYQILFPHLGGEIDRVVEITAGAEQRHVSDGEFIGRYQVGKELARGSCGVVFRGECIETEKAVAIKVAASQSALGSTADLCGLIRAEAEVLQQLRHPSIMPFVELTESKYGPVLIMPFFENGTLRSRLTSEPCDVGEFVSRLIPMLQAVNHAHVRGIVHRDIEPGNILIGDDGRFVLGDFGLSVHESVQHHTAGESAGSMGYMSPEQIRGESHWLEGRADIWAIGVILFEALTGRRPFRGETAAQISDQILFKPIKPPRQIRPEICPQLEEICLKCLARNPDQRFLTASDLATALHDWHSKRPAQRAASDQSRNPPRPSFTTQTAFSFAAAFTACLMAVIAWTWAQAGGDIPVTPTVAVSPTPVDGMLGINVFVFRGNQRFEIADYEALPIRPNDQLLMQFQTRPEIHLTAFLVDVYGHLQPIQAEPNRAEPAHTEPAHTEPAQAEPTPPNASDALTWIAPPQRDDAPGGFSVSDGESGAELLVVISTSEFIDQQTMQARLPSLLDQRDERFSEPVYYRNGVRRVRGTVVAGAESAVSENQARIWNAMRDRGWSVDVIAWSFENNSNSDQEPIQ